MAADSGDHVADLEAQGEISDLMAPNRRTRPQISAGLTDARSYFTGKSSRACRESVSRWRRYRGRRRWTTKHSPSSAMNPQAAINKLTKRH